MPCAGRTAGLPLLAPWANRLGGRRYRAAGAPSTCGLPLQTDFSSRPWPLIGSAVDDHPVRQRAR
jgi:hypothetical protein